MAFPAVRTGPARGLAQAEILRLVQFPAVRARISAGLERTRVLGVDATPRYVVFRLQDPAAFHPALFATIPLGSRGTMATIGTPRAAVRDARRLAEFLRSRGWLAGERRWLRTPDEAERRSTIYQLRKAGIVGGSRAQRVLIPRARVEAALRAFVGAPVRVAANRNGANGSAEYAIVKGGKYLTMTFTPPASQRFWWGPKSMARTYKSAAAAASEYALIVSHFPDMAGGSPEAFSYPNPRRCPPGMKWSARARRCVPRRAAANMDPKAALDLASRLLAEGDTTEAAYAVEGYIDWRAKGGFQPPGGDERARRIVASIGRSVGGELLAKLRAFGGRPSANPILATIGFNPGRNPLTREEKKRLTAIARERASLGVLAARELGDDPEALERSTEYEVGRYFGGSDMAKQIRDTFTRRRAGPSASPNPRPRAWSMHDAAQRSAGLGKPYSLHLAVLHKSGSVSHPVGPWKHDQAIASALAMERRFGPALVVWPVLSPMQGQLPYLHRVDLARAVRGTAADVRRVQTGAANPLTKREAAQMLRMAHRHAQAAKGSGPSVREFVAGSADAMTWMAQRYGPKSLRARLASVGRRIRARAHGAAWPMRNPVSGPVDEHAATELELYVENDAQLHRSQEVPIIRNLMRRRAKGTFDFELSVRLWQYLIDAGARKYVKEFGTPGARIDSVFNKATRQHVARRFAKHFVAEAELGNYDKLVWGVSNNPLTDAEAQRSLGYAKGSLRQAKKWPKGSTGRHWHAGQAAGQASVVHDRSDRFMLKARRVILDADKAIGVPGTPNPARPKKRPLDVYVMGDQPATCPKCGARTQFVTWSATKQKHVCPRCKYSFVLVAENRRSARTNGAAANPSTMRGQSITIPFRDGQKITPERMRTWLDSLPAGAVKDMLVRRFEQGVEQYRKFHLGSEPRTFTYKAVPMGAQRRVTDVDFVVSEGKEWAAPYQVPKHSEKYQAETQGRYIHSHGESGAEVTIKKPASLKRLPERFHTADGKFVGVIPSRNVKITDWYRG